MKTTRIRTERARGDAANPRRPDRRRWLLLGGALLAAAGVTWVLLEFFVWNRLPAALVGVWVVEGGEQDGATFDFHRDGTMIGRLNNLGKVDMVQAQVAVEGDTLLITTRHPRTGAEKTVKQKITTMDGHALALQDERGVVHRMTRRD